MTVLKDSISFGIGFHKNCFIAVHITPDQNSRIQVTNQGQIKFKWKVRIKIKVKTKVE